LHTSVTRRRVFLDLGMLIDNKRWISPIGAHHYPSEDNCCYKPRQRHASPQPYQPISAANTPVITKWQHHTEASHCVHEDGDAWSTGGTQHIECDAFRRIHYGICEHNGKCLVHCAMIQQLCVCALQLQPQYLT
jgi:hypothetical protein